MPRDTEGVERLHGQDRDCDDLQPTCEGMADIPGLSDQDDTNGEGTSPSTDRTQ